MGEVGEARQAAAAFHRRVGHALADAPLREALASTTRRLSDGRIDAFAAVADADALRHRARDARERAIAHLDVHLARFADAATAAGCQVHWADTAADATRIVTGIARQRGISRAVKSKSMVSEELGLNEALEHAGVRVVETDLGEFVVQVADDRPSHIITPIIHLRRGDVATLFQDRLGASHDEVADIPAMTAFARRRLRAEFLQAGMGISGANFAVAETGTLCLVTNEGNGRLTTTAPRVHVALLGRERIVETMGDLEACVQVLARSATGQALSTYTTWLTGPRRRPASGTAGDPDGPDELHVVIIDNGRSRLLNSDLSEILYCIRCGACLNVCPVYQRTGGHAYGSVYPGPMGSIVTPGLMGLAGSAELPHASSLCGACRDACPVQIDLPRLLLTARQQTVRAGYGPGWARTGMSIYAWIAARPRLFRLTGRTLSWFGAITAREGWIRSLPGPLGAWTRTRDFPAPAAQSFLDRRRRDGESRRRPHTSPTAAATRPAAPAPHVVETHAAPDAVAVSRPAPPGRPAKAPEQDLSSTHARVEAFVGALHALGGRVHTAPTRTEAVELVATLFDLYAASDFISWDEAAIPCPGLLDALESLGRRRITYDVPVDAEGRAAALATLEPVTIGLTGAHGAVAASGTLVLTSGPGCGRLCSLLPPVHIAVIRARDICPTLGAWMTAHPGRASEGSQTVLITGPSRTADIEMTLTHGVHGPKHLHVVLMTETGA